MKNLDFLTTTKFAHRGLHNNKNQIPENSMLAYQLALNSSYGIELDIQADVNGTFFCFHDSNTLRMTHVDKDLKGSSYDEIRKYDLLNSDEKIPLFTDLLKLINGKVPLLIEIKTHKNYKKTLFKFIELMDKYQGEFAVFSFNPLIVNWFKKHKPSYIRGQITSYFTENKKMPKIGKFIMKRLLTNIMSKPDFVSYNKDNLPNKYAQKVKDKGLVLISYTARSLDEMNLALKYCDNIVFENFIPYKK